MKGILISLVRFYQRVISPMKGGATCKFVPHCSEYAIQALEKHGAFKGTILAIWRVLRCNPFSEGGVDPVPDVWPGKMRFR